MTIKCDGCGREWPDGDETAQVMECIEAGCSNDCCKACEDVIGRCLECQKADMDARGDDGD